MGRCACLIQDIGERPARLHERQDLFRGLDQHKLHLVPHLCREIFEVALVPNGDLQFVSERIAREKVLRLGAAKTATVEAA